MPYDAAGWSALISFLSDVAIIGARVSGVSIPAPHVPMSP